ncbi:MAG: cytochrome c [Lewinellaceae bacterium]|mgnify:FL=1|nr:cytochrome c [Lewinellaceae bacterium]
MFKKINTALFALFLGIGACESAAEKTSQQETAANNISSSTEKPDGMAIFRQHCVICHGSDGNLGLNGAKHLPESVLPLEERINIITNGKNLMTPFRSQLNPEEIQAVAAYTLTLKK